MNQSLSRPQRFFFGTRALPCPYVPGRVERKVVTDLAGPHAQDLYERLTRAGFRRSHGLTYRPACPSCTACVPVRIVVDRFEPSGNLKRIVRRNAELGAEDMAAIATMEQYRLFMRYQRTRHAGGDMALMTFGDYRAMVEESPVDTRIVEYRNRDGTLVAAMLADRMSDSLSAVYSFYDPDDERLSLGSYMILWLVERAKAHGLDYVYLGYWIPGSDKMGYKVRFHPLERLGPHGWVALDR
jgi:arginine-tRNA-protein transferase